jgi:hypothetical protein
MPSTFVNNALQEIGTLWDRMTRWMVPVKASAKVILESKVQVRAWRKANQTMGWGIHQDEFDAIGQPPEMTDKDRKDGFVGVVLSYGFGDDGHGHADAVLSGKVAWEYAVKCRKRIGGTWKCEYVRFDDPKFIRLRENASPRPRGFYFRKVQLGKKFHNLSVQRVRKELDNDIGFGPEGIQFLAITHPHYIKVMDGHDFPFISLPDYDIAPHGFGDFYDAPFLLATRNVLGMGVGNVSRPYPRYGSGTLR